MARYLPTNYEPIPDALLWSGADLIDVTRRIARNQNWIWANHGAVFAAFGQEPMTAQEPTVTGSATLDCAYFACPNRSATGSDSVRVAGYVTTTGAGVFESRVRLYQLLPGETAPTADTPYDDSAAINTIGADLFFDFDARIRSGSDPLRFVLRLVGVSGTPVTKLLSCTVTWKRNPASVLGETVAPWQAISQSYVAADKPVSAALLRAISNRTLKLLAENPRPIFTHSFIWPRRSTTSTGSTRVALYTVRHDGLTTNPKLAGSIRYLVSGQNAVVDFTVKANGSTLFQSNPHSPTLVNGAYVAEGSFASVAAVAAHAG